MSTTRDFSKLDAVMAFISEYPKAHSQRAWIVERLSAPAVQIPGDGEVCGTAACVAGWTLLLEHQRYEMRKYQGEPRIWDKRVGRWLTDTGGDYVSHARCVLGLAPLEAEVLFDGGMTPDGLVLAVADLKAGTLRDVEDYYPEDDDA